MREFRVRWPGPWPGRRQRPAAVLVTPVTTLLAFELHRPGALLTLWVAFVLIPVADRLVWIDWNNPELPRPISRRLLREPRPTQRSDDRAPSRPLAPRADRPDAMSRPPEPKQQEPVRSLYGHESVLRSPRTLPLQFDAAAETTPGELMLTPRSTQIMLDDP